MELMLKQDWSGIMNRTLIIGGNGYIGNRLREHLDDVDIIDTCWFGEANAREFFGVFERRNVTRCKCRKECCIERTACTDMGRNDRPRKATAHWYEGV